MEVGRDGFVRVCVGMFDQFVEVGDIGGKVGGFVEQLFLSLGKTKFGEGDIVF